MAIISSEHYPIKSLLFLKNVLVRRQQIKKHVVSRRALKSQHSPVPVIFCMITCRRGLLGSTRFPHLSVAPLWRCIVLIRAPHIWVGTGTKKALPLQNLSHQRAFVVCVCVSACIQYEHNIHTQETATQTGMYWQSTVMFTIAPLQVFLWWKRCLCSHSLC